MKKESSFLHRNFSKENIRESYSRVAQFYNSWSRTTESKAASRVLELAQIKDGEQVLEVAVGTGLVFEQIIKQNKKGLNIGVDISPSMLSRAKKCIKEFDKKNFHLQIASAYRLPFKTNAFDLVVNNYMFDLLPE